MPAAFPVRTTSPSPPVRREPGYHRNRSTAPGNASISPSAKSGGTEPWRQVFSLAEKQQVENLLPQLWPTALSNEPSKQEQPAYRRRNCPTGDKTCVPTPIC